MWAVVTSNIEDGCTLSVHLFSMFDDARKYVRKKIGEYVDFCSDEYDFIIQDNGMDVSFSCIETEPIKWEIIKADFELKDMF